MGNKTSGNIYASSGVNIFANISLEYLLVLPIWLPV